MDLFDQLLNKYAEIEVAKANANASGKEHTQQKLTTERANAAAVQVEKPAQATQSTPAAPVAQPNTFNIGGVKVNKMLAAGGGALLLGALAFKAFKK